MTIEGRAKEYADAYCVGDAAIIVDLVRKVACESYLAGATEQKEIDMTLFLELCEKWKRHYTRKCNYPSDYSKTIAPSQFDAVDLLLTDAFKEMGIDEETFRKAQNKEE